MNCPKCGTEMKLGRAIDPIEESNCHYFAPQPLINSETLRLIDVLKCPKCGHSDDELNSL